MSHWASNYDVTCDVGAARSGDRLEPAILGLSGRRSGRGWSALAISNAAMKSDLAAHPTHVAARFFSVRNASTAGFAAVEFAAVGIDVACKTHRAPDLADARAKSGGLGPT